MTAAATTARPEASTLSLDQFHGSESAWNDLVLSSRFPLPFQSFPWLSLWWRQFGSGMEFVAPVVRRGPEIVAAVPLAIRRVRFFGRTFTVGEIVGTGPVPTRGMGLADKSDFIVKKGDDEAMRLLCREATKLLDRVDLLDIKAFDASSPVPACLIEEAPRPDLGRVLDRSVSPYLSLPPTWEEYLKGRSRNFRKHLKKYGRLLDKAGSWEIGRMEADDDVAAWTAEIVELNHKSWKASRGTNLFRAPEIKAFMVDLVSEMAKREWLDLQLLRVDGRAVAYELCFDFGGRFFSYNGSFREDLRQASPGTVLTAAVIESACGRGRSEYDMLRGDEEYKARWSPTFRSESQLLLPASRPSGRLLSAALRSKARLKKQRWVHEISDRIGGFLARSRYGD